MSLSKERIDFFSKFHYLFDSSWELRRFRHYAKTIESSFSSKIQLLEEKFSNSERIEEFWKAESSTANASFKEAIYKEGINEELFDADYQLQYIHRRSLLITLHSFLESTLSGYCIRYKDDLLSLNDLSGNGIEKAKSYIIKVLKEDFPFDSAEWGFFMEVNKIRNCLAHNNGIVGTMNSKLRKLIEKLDGISLYSLDNQEEQIYIEDYFFDLYIDRLDAFFNACIKSLKADFNGDMIIKPPKEIRLFD